MSLLLRSLGFIWLLPMTILIWLIYVLPLWAFGQIKFSWRNGFIVYFTLSEKDNAYTRLWHDWAGWSGPCVIVTKKINPYSDRLTLKHEYRHCMQQFVFGCFHYPLYGLIFALYWAFTDKDPYRDNPFEIDARNYAGQ